MIAAAAEVFRESPGNYLVAAATRIRLLLADFPVWFHGRFAFSCRLQAPSSGRTGINQVNNAGFRQPLTPAGDAFYGFRRPVVVRVARRSSARS